MMVLNPPSLNSNTVLEFNSSTLVEVEVEAEREFEFVGEDI